MQKATLTLFVAAVNGVGTLNVYPVTSSWAQGDTTEPAYDVADPAAVAIPVTAANSYVTIDIT